MGALGHHIEAQGVATAGISLVREHTEVIKPPRALWVPFELGRPFGPPNDADFQRDVLRTLLGLFGRDIGPVLEDYPREAPSTGADAGTWACPLPLPPRPEPATPAEEFERRLLDEVAALRPWYDEARRIRGRTLVGTSGVEMEAAAALIGAIASGRPAADPPGARVSLPGLLRFAADDLKAFYIEAATARPGSRPPESGDLDRWLYEETAFGEALHRARAQLASAEDAAWKAQSRMLVPASLVRRQT